MPKAQVVLIPCSLDEKWDERVFHNEEAPQKEKGTGEISRLFFSTIFLPSQGSAARPECSTDTRKAGLIRYPCFSKEIHSI